MCCDYEEILVQERIQMLDVGTMPRSITVILLHDLVDSCKVCLECKYEHFRLVMILLLLVWLDKDGSLYQEICSVK